MFATRNDVPAAGILRPDEIARLQGVGARAVVVEKIDGKVTALACWMKRGENQFIAWRTNIPLGEMTAAQRETFIDRAVQRTAEYHDGLPLTDEELALFEAQGAR